MTEVNSTWFLVQHLENGADDYEEFCINFCGLISFLSECEKGDMIKIRKIGVRFTD